jgi:hypothetical protein
VLEETCPAKQSICHAGAYSVLRLLFPKGSEPKKYFCLNCGVCWNALTKSTEFSATLVANISALSPPVTLR